MATTAKGFQGTVSDTDMATQLGGHHLPTVRSAQDLKVSVFANDRNAYVSAGVSDSAFVKVTLDQDVAFTLAAPSSGGKWYAITVDRQWSPSNTVAVRADDLGISDGVGTAPTTVPAGVINAIAALQDKPGTSGSTAGQRHVLAAVYSRAADANMVAYDLRFIRTAAGVLSVTGLHAIAVMTSKLLDGAVVSVPRHTTPNGYLHRSSQWTRTNGVFIPTPGTEILLEGVAFASAASGLADITLLVNGYGNLALYGNETMGWVASSKWRWNGTTWQLWERSNLQTGDIIDPASGTGLDTNGSIFEASVAGGVLFLHYNLYRNAGVQANTALATMKAGFRPAGRVQHTCTVYGAATGPGTAYVGAGGDIGVDSWASGSSSVGAVRGEVFYRLAA